jgi:outer membrane protein assembly factor BamB
VDSSAALGHEGTILVGSWDGALYCLEASGQQQWKFETGGPIVSSPAIGLDGVVYFGSHDGKFYAVNASGIKKWEYNASAPIISSPALNGSDCIYITSVNGFCHALNADGTLRWKLFTGGITEASPVIAQNGNLHLGVNRAMWTINPAGHQIQNYATHEEVVNAAAALNDGSYAFVSRRGLVLCLTPQRTLVWSFNAQAQGYASPAVGPKGTIYLPTYLHQRDFSALENRQPLAQSPWPKFRGNSRNTGNAMDN